MNDDINLILCFGFILMHVWILIINIFLIDFIISFVFNANSTFTWFSFCLTITTTFFFSFLMFKILDCFIFIYIYIYILNWCFYLTMFLIVFKYWIKGIFMCVYMLQWFMFSILIFLIFIKFGATNAIVIILELYSHHSLKDKV